MKDDISELLSSWAFEPGRMQARLIVGDDARPRLQIRLDLGVLQMLLDGRPDGEQPHGAESFLDHFRQREAQLGRRIPLDAEELTELMREGVQYYNRYMALFTLQDYDRVARDTARNLELFGFVSSRVEADRDRWAFQQYVPFVTMMHARALGEKALLHSDPREALRVIDKAIESITEFLRESGREEDTPECPELNFLQTWRGEVELLRESDAVERLQEQQSLAVAREDYEQAAKLRDQIRQLRQRPPRATTRARSRKSPKPAPPDDPTTT